VLFGKVPYPNEIERSLWWKPSVFRAFVRRGKTVGGSLMKTPFLATIIAIGTAIAVPALAQQSSGTNPQMQDEADKGVKTRNSGESGYVGEQERPGASSHAPGQPDAKSNQTTTGTSSGTSSGQSSETGGKPR